MDPTLQRDKNSHPSLTHPKLRQSCTTLESYKGEWSLKPHYRLKLAFYHLYLPPSSNPLFLNQGVASSFPLGAVHCYGAGSQPTCPIATHHVDPGPPQHSEEGESLAPSHLLHLLPSAWHLEPKGRVLIIMGEI